MANYVWNKVLCDKNTLENYFMDYNPFGDGELLVEPYITFNKLFDVASLDEYSKKIGIHISYDYGFSYERKGDNQYEVMFCTRWKYPIEAIKKALTMFHNMEWYAVEENCIYVSKFCWNGGINESVMVIEKEYDSWLGKNMEFCDSLKTPDCAVWHYLQSVEEIWQDWESDNGFQRYEDSVVNITLPFFKTK